jgi:hypothetical protein
MVLTFTGHTFPLSVTDSLKNGSSMVLTFIGQLFPSGQCSIRIKWFFKSIEFNRLGSFKGYCDLIFLRYSCV